MAYVFLFGKFMVYVDFLAIEYKWEKVATVLADRVR